MSNDGFELEQCIMECWQVCEDLKKFDIDRQTLANYYEAKFNKLWEIFEELTHERYFNNVARKTPSFNPYDNESETS
jgi:hypothetical protein